MIRFSIITVLVGMCLSVGGCSPDVGSSDSDEKNSPLAQKAKLAADAGDLDGAAKFYRKALDGDPRMARVHLDLVLILHRMEGKKDYVGTIYHYRKYIELRPDTEKRKMIENRIRLASHAYAGRVLGSGRTGNQPMIKKLEEENVKLKGEMELLQRKNQILKDKIQQRRIVEEESPEPGSRSGKRSYKVQYGDTLESIAVFFYEDANRANDIYDRNKALIKDPKSLIAGQVFVIP